MTSGPDTPAYKARSEKCLGGCAVRVLMLADVVVCVGRAMEAADERLIPEEGVDAEDGVLDLAEDCASRVCIHTLALSMG
jgi:hypothetical protein